MKTKLLKFAFFALERLLDVPAVAAVELATEGLSPFGKCFIGFAALVCWFLLVELAKAFESKRQAHGKKSGQEE